MISEAIKSFKDGNQNGLEEIYKYEDNTNFLNRQKRETVLETIEVEDFTPIFKSKLFDYIKQFLNETEYQIMTMHLLGDIKFNEMQNYLIKMKIIKAAK